MPIALRTKNVHARLCLLLDHDLVCQSRHRDDFPYIYMHMYMYMYVQAAMDCVLVTFYCFGYIKAFIQIICNQKKKWHA